MSSKIIEAVKNSHYSQLNLFKRHNYNFKVKSPPSGSNILMTALEIPEAHKRYRMLEYLLRQDVVDVRDCDKNGHDVFFVAVMREQARELDLLMRLFHTEVEWTRADRFGKTLLHYAVAGTNLKILEILLIYCAKYKISVDIPDKINKITPYLLACRLNNQQAADLLLEIGHASPMQADKSSFFDAERWKEEGQREKLKSYLKAKEEEMNYAKLCGNMKLYKELSSLSRQLDDEILKKSEMLPILAKIIIDNENLNVNNNNLPSTGRLVSRTRAERMFRENTNSNIFITTCGQSQSSNISLNDSSVTSFGGFSNNNTNNNHHYHHQLLKSKSTFELNPNLNAILRQAMNSLNKKRTTNDSSTMNSLLEMTDGKTNVDHFVGSKSEATAEATSIGVSSGSTSGGSRGHQYHSHHQHSHSSHSSMHSQHQHAPASPSISNVFYEASMQKTGNFRAGIAYNPVPVKIERPKPPVSPVKPKSNLSSFRLIAISEGSRLTSHSTKRVNFRNKASTIAVSPSKRSIK